MDFISIWANAVAQFEGFNQPGSRAARNHNPGNLKYAGQSGATGKDPNNFAVFSNDASGFQALYRQLAKYVSDFPGYSILEITAHYLGQPAPQIDQEGDAFAYANFVAGQLGVEPSMTLEELAHGASDAVIDFGSSMISPLSPESGGAQPPMEDPKNLLILVVAGGVIFWLIGRIFGS